MMTRASRQGEAADVPPDADEPGGLGWNAAAARVTLRRHWLFALLLTLGVLLRVMDRPKPRPAAPVGGRCGTDDACEPLFPGDGAAAVDSLLPFGRQQARDVTHGENDMYLGWEQRLDATVGLRRVARRQHLV